MSLHTLSVLVEDKPGDRFVLSPHVQYSVFGGGSH